MEAEFAQSGDNLTELGIIKLAGDRRRHNSVYFIILIAMAALQHIYNIQNKRFIADGTERTCIYACAARNALVIIDASLLVLTHIDSLDLAGILARALVVHYCGVGADLCAGAAFDAL